MIDFNLFKDPEPFIFYQWSFMMIIEFIYHTIFYYGMADKQIKKPDFNYILLFIIFHMIQVYAVKYFHINKKYIYAWLVIIVPGLLYLAYQKYQDRVSTAEQLQYWKYIASVQQQNQGPPAPPDGQFPQYNTMKHGSEMIQPQVTKQPGLAPPPPVNQPPQYTTNQPNYGYGQDLNAQVMNNNTNAFAEFSANEFDPFSSPYTAL